MPKTSLKILGFIGMLAASVSFAAGLEGHWLGDCESVGSGFYSITQLSFEKGEYRAHTDVYDDLHCAAGVGQRTNDWGSYVEGDAFGEGTALDLVFNTRSDYTIYKIEEGRLYLGLLAYDAKFRPTEVVRKHFYRRVK